MRSPDSHIRIIGGLLKLIPLIIFKYRKRRVKQQDLQAESAIVPDSDVSEEKS